MYKERPAVVIQNNIGNRNSATTIIAPITGGGSGYPFHVNLSASTSGLEKDSYAALDQIRTVDIEERILEKVGSVNAADLDRIDAAIEISLGLR
jgi:mRNA interferase MazF